MQLSNQVLLPLPASAHTRESSFKTAPYIQKKVPTAFCDQFWATTENLQLANRIFTLSQPSQLLNFTTHNSLAGVVFQILIYQYKR